MSVFSRVAKGAQAGAITAGVIEASFFVLDLVRLRPLATPAALSGVGLGPAGFTIDLTNSPGVVDALWAGYQISMLSLAHFAAFAVVGVVAALTFDWTRPGGMGRFAAVAVSCVAAFYATVGWSGSIVALESVGGGVILGMNLLATLILGAVLRVASMPEPEDAPSNDVGR